MKSRDFKPKENGMKLMIRIAAMACLAVLAAAQAMAAAPRTFVVLPFQVNGPQGYGYLEKAIPSTLSSRLYWQGETKPLSAKITRAPASEAAARKAQAAVGADYVVWGTATVVGNDCTLDVRMRDKAGKEWRKTSQTPVNGLMGALSGLADALSSEAFGRPVSGGAAADGRPVVNQMNPDIVVNQTGQQQVYLNPQFRYQGAGANDGSRMRSQTLPFVMVDMAVGDFDGDGKNEVAILSDHKLYVYRWESNGRLKPLAETVVSMTNQSFSMRAISLTRGRAQQLVVVTFEEENNRPYSYIYTFEGGTLREFCRRSEYFLSVAKLPPNFTPTLIGQAWDSLKLFHPGVHIMHRNGDRYVFGSKLELPSGANVFNFAWMPGDKKNGDKLIVLNEQERLKIYNQPKGEAIHTTMDHFSGSSTGMNHYKTMAGLGIDRNYQLPDKYFSPMRLITASLERNGEYVLLVNKPISTASQFFDRHRFFPQGEIHALYWDGVGMGLKWKTRRIRGSVASVDLADLNNNGVMDLVVGLNTHPGPVGVGSRRCLITAYPLDLSRTDPNTAPDMHDFEN